MEGSAQGVIVLVAIIVPLLLPVRAERVPDVPELGVLYTVIGLPELEVTLEVKLKLKGPVTVQ